MVAMAASSRLVCINNVPMEIELTQVRVGLGKLQQAQMRSSLILAHGRNVYQDRPEFKNCKCICAHGNRGQQRVLQTPDFCRSLCELDVPFSRSLSGSS